MVAELHAAELREVALGDDAEADARRGDHRARTSDSPSDETA
jgi:hypothetical protein